MKNKVTRFVQRYFSAKEISQLPAHILNYLRTLLAKPFMAICNKLFFDTNKIVFDNFSGAGYGGNPKFIAEEIIKRKHDYHLIWLVDGNCNYSFPSQIVQVKIGTWKELYELATAKIWVDNVRKLSTIHKSKNQYYIQTWHGGGPCLKMVEKDAQNNLDEAYVRSAMHDSEMADLFISGCDWRSKNYRNAFWYDGEILCSGTPSSDVLFTKTENELNEVKQSLHIHESYKIAIYAPTFRNNHEISCYNLNYSFLLNTLKQKFGGEWCVIIRLHPTIAKQENNIKYTNRVINGSLHPQIEDLILISEVLITDFSGCMFDAFRLKKKVFLYASDYDEYVKRERKLYFDLNELPSSLSRTNDELNNNILSFNENIYSDKLESFLKYINYYPEGHSAEQIVDRIDCIIKK